MELKTENNTYEVVYFKRKDELYNIYVHKTSNLTNNYIGEAVYSIGSKSKTVLELGDVLNLTYRIG